MSDRIFVDPDLSPAWVPVRVLNEMRSHALETLPEECCGLLLGPKADCFEQAHRCRNDMTLLHHDDPERHPRDGRHAFHMNEGDHAAILAKAEASGQGVTAVYHSHVEAGAYFSEVDQQFVRAPEFPYPDAMHFVVSLAGGVVREVAAFRWDARQGRFEGRAVEVMPA